MKSRIRLLVAAVLAACGLALLLGLLAASSQAETPVSSRNLQQGETPCAFRSITVTAAGLGATPGVSDTLPGGPYSRTLYFANLQPGVITVSVTISEGCYAWGGPAFSQTERLPFQPEAGSQRWLTYSVGTGHVPTTMVLTSSLYITGSMVITVSRSVVLTFTQDITPPLVFSPTITEYSDSLHAVDTRLYYSNTIQKGTEYSFWVGGGASDDPSGLARATFTPAFDDASFEDIAPASWEAKYDVSRENSGDGVITATLYDWVGLATPQPFPYELDGMPPTSTITSDPASPRSESVQLKWEANDTQSGVRVVELWYQKETTGTWQPTNITGTGTAGTFEEFTFPAGDGRYLFATKATDNLRNVEAGPTVSETQALYDHSIPASRVTRAPAYTRTSPITVTWEATATVSGLAETRLWYRNGGAWVSTTLTSTEDSGRFKFDFPQGEGGYDLATRATSRAGKQEQVPDQGDVTVIYDCTINPPDEVTVTPAGWTNTNAFTVTWNNPDDLSGIAGVRYSIGVTPTHNLSGTSETEQDTDALTNLTVSDDGEHTVWIWLKDNAGNVNYTTAQTTTLRYDATPPTGVVITAPEHISDTTFVVAWGSDCSVSGLDFYDVSYRIGEGAWHEWVTETTEVSQTFPASQTDVDYTFRVTAYDRAGNSAQDETTTRVGPFYIYLPLVVRNYAPFVNGDFEAQLAGWTAGGKLLVKAVTELYSGAPPPSITGVYAARLGGDDTVYTEGQVPVDYGTLWQTFSVPDVSNPEITIRYRVATHDVVYGPTTHDYFDDFEVSVDVPPWEILDNTRDAVGCNQSSPVPSIIDVSSAGLAFCDGNRTGDPTGTEDLHDTRWHTVTLRLGSPLKGKNITLYLANFNRVDGHWNTWTYVDEVNVNW